MTKRLGKGLVFGIYIVLIIRLFRYLGINSDQANHLLQADDILQGNFFLKDWNLTGVTFFTTDLIYEEIARLLCGVSYRAIYVANGLKYSSIAFAAYYAVRKGCGKNQILTIALLLLFAGVPCMNYMQHVQVHAGAVCLIFLSFCVVHDIVEESDQNSRRLSYKYGILFLITAFGAIGDLLAVIEGTVSLVLFCIYKLLMTNEKNENLKYARLIVVMSIGMVTAFVWDKFYFFIGRANKNSYIGDQRFTGLSEWASKIESFMRCILDMNMANFTESKISDIWNLAKFVNAAVILAALVLICRIIWNMVQGNKTDTLSELLAISIIMSFLAFVFTDMAQPRYITLIPFAAVIIVIRNLNRLMDFIKNKRLCIVLIIMAASASFAGKLHELSNYEYPQSDIEDYELISFLDEKELHYGYASFWNASKITVLSKKNINIRHIIHFDEEKRFEMHNWFNKNEWYHEDTRFILIDNSDKERGKNDGFGVSEENVIDFFGNPKETYEINKYLIIVYDHSLSM